MDGLRAGAVVGVIVYHCINYAHSLPALPAWLSGWPQVIGRSCVQTFFIISGFIITRLLMEEHRQRGAISLRAFYLRRCFRILPPLAAFLITLTALQAAGWIHIPRSSILKAAVFLGNTDWIDERSWFVSHTWSLAVEEQFYLLFPPLLVILLKCRQRHPSQWLLGLFAVCVLIPKGAHWLTVHVDPFWNGLNRFYAFRYILVGVIAALEQDQVIPHLRNRSRFWPVALGTASLGLQYLPVHSTLRGAIDAVEPWLACGFVLWFIENPDRCAVLRFTWVQRIGVASYSLYLWQQLFTASSEFYGGIILSRLPIAIPALLLCVAGTVYGIERPTIRFGRMLSQRILTRPPSPR